VHRSCTRQKLARQHRGCIEASFALRPRSFTHAAKNLKSMKMVRLALLALWAGVAGGATTIAPSPAPSPVPTLMPTQQPTVTEVPTNTPHPSPAPTPAPTHKPTEFPTYSPYAKGSAREQLIQAIAMLCACVGLGLFLGFGNVKQDWDRAKRKLRKARPVGSLRTDPTPP
jgi:hypothetical protein